MEKRKKILGIIPAVALVILVVCYFSFWRTFTVTYALQLGPGVPAQTVKVGDVAKEPETPSYPGYKFIGWYQDDKVYDFSTPVKKDITLTAKWEKEN